MKNGRGCSFKYSSMIGKENKIGENMRLEIDNHAIDMLLEYLKNKKVLSDLEKDIYSTANICRKMPFDREEGRKKIIENNSKHPDICVSINSTPGRTIKPFDQVTDEDIRYNLWLQVVELCAKASINKNSGEINGLI